MKKIKFYNIISLLIILSVAISAYFFNSMLPDRMITHWNINGQADGWGDKSTLVVFIPFLIIGLYILFRFTQDIMNHDCECSNDWDRKFVYYYSLISTTIYVIWFIISFYNEYIH